MPVNTPHPEYAANAPAWERIKICLKGHDAVRAAGIAYLPMLSGQDAAGYKTWADRALFFNATGRTSDAMQGFLHRKPPTVKLPSDLDYLLTDCDLSGTPLQSYVRKVAAVTCSTGRGGTLVDYSDGESRPYLCFYPELSVINWRVERIEGNNKLTLLVLREEAQEIGASGDRFTPRVLTRYRVLELIDGEVWVSVWESKDDRTSATPILGTGQASAYGVTPYSSQSIATVPADGAYQTQEPILMHRRGFPLTSIPFVFHGSETSGETIDKPPLADISIVNLSHYRSTVDLENGRHVAGNPTPWARCFGQDDGEKLYVGSSYAWTSDNENAMCGYLEFTGQGLTPLTEALKEKQEQMAALGARLIETRPADAESYDTVSLRASAETSTLARIGLLLTETMTQALRIAEWWTSTSDEVNPEVEFTLNKDFTSAAMQAEMLAAIVSACGAGMMSKTTAFHNMQRGELYPEGWTKEEEFGEIDANPLVMPMPPQPVPGKPPAKPPAK